MKTFATLLTALALCMANVALADNVVIPTTSENAFDLTKGVITSSDTHQHFTNNGVEWMMDGDKLVYTLQNTVDADCYYASIWFGTDVDNVTVDLNLKSQSGSTVVDTTFAVTRNGWYQKNDVYRVKTKAMAKGNYTLTFTFHSAPGNNTANISRIRFETPQTVTIPTTDDNPIDLTKALVLSRNNSQHFSQWSSMTYVDNMMNEDQLVLELQNDANADYYNIMLDLSTDRSDASVDVLLTNANGTAVADTTLNVVNRGGHNISTYTVQARPMPKGKYTLTLTYHWPERNDWAVAYLWGISVKNPKALTVGGEVELQNPEFNDNRNGWTFTGCNPSTSGEVLGNRVLWTGNYESAQTFEPTVYNLPNGLYLVQVNAYDQVSNPANTAEQVLAEHGGVIPSYLYANGQQVQLKTVFDDALTGQNRYRWYQGLSMNYFTGEGSTAFMPAINDGTSAAFSLTHHPFVYLNSLVVAVTNGQLTIGVKKTDTDRSSEIIMDHWRVTYLSKDTKLPAKNGRAYNRQLLDDAIRAAGGSPVSTETDDQALNRLIALEDERDRQSYPLLSVTVEQPGTLGDEIFAQKGNDFNLADLKRIKIEGQLNDADLVTLRDRCTGLIEVDMSKALNTAFVDAQFRNHYYLRYVVLPDYLESLPSNAFNQCYNLNSVTLPATMKQIGSGAFYRCYNLRQAVIPEGVTSIGDEAYKESGLWNIQFPSTLKVIPSGTCYYCYELTDIGFNGQTDINQSYAFANCTHLRRVVMPGTMEHIYNAAFHNCTRLADMQLNEGLVDIWNDAFNNCPALTQITLPSSVQALYGCPFSSCDNLQNMTCLSVAPPYTSSPVISGSGRKNPFGGRESDKNRTISVPYISQNVYKQTEGWDYHNIVTHSDLPKSVYINMPYNMTWPAELMAQWKPNIYITPNAKNTASEGGNGGMLTYGQLYVGTKAAFSADTLNLYYSYYAAREADNRKFFTPLLVNGTGRADVIRTEINVAKDYWTFFSVPYDVDLKQMTSTHPDDPFVIRTYDGEKRANGQLAEAWVNVPKDGTLKAGQGYIIRTTNGDWYQNYNNYFLPSVNNGNKTRYFTNEDVVVPLENYPTEFAHNRSWNFIGNPYPCFFDIRAMQTTSPITIWNRRSQYETYSPLDDDYILNPGQALFIQRPLDQSQVIFLKEGRQNDLTIRDTIYYNNVRVRAAAAQPRQVYNLRLASPTPSKGGEQLLDRTRFVINERASLGYDAGYDASKFFAEQSGMAERFSTEPGVAHLYTLDGDVLYAINERPMADGELLLGLQLSQGGTYTIALQTKAEGTVTLIDKQNGIETDLTTAAYTFQAEAGTLNSRFVLRLGTTDGVQSVALPTQQTEQLYDLQGRRTEKPQKGIYVKNGKKVVR